MFFPSLVVSDTGAGPDIIERAEKLEQSVEDSEAGSESAAKLNFRIEKQRSAARSGASYLPLFPAV
jgi:hypothetical protein